MNQNASLYSGTNSSTSTLRPRNNRLLSFLDDDPPDTSATSSSTQTAAPLFGSRGTSPNPPSRTRSLNKGSEVGSISHARTASGSKTTAQNNDIWSSWSSYASSFLAGDSSATSKGKGKAVAGSRPPKWMKQDHTYSTAMSVPKWGLSSKDMPTAKPGTLEDRHAMLQAEKRKALLNANAAVPDGLGKFKRRDSDALIPYDDAGNVATSTEGSGEREDALVYMHRVGKGDTLAGVMLKYGCQQDVFRKVNRFWPNDEIRIRKWVWLPVEACSVKGPKVEKPEAQSNQLQHADGAGDGLHSISLQNGTQHTDDLSRPTTPFPLLDDESLKHDSWVSLPNFPEPVEILRTSRRSLGYFPRARRKSNTLLSPSMSGTSTPRTSFDTLRHPPSHAAQLSASLSLNASPVRRPLSSIRRDSGMQRTRSNSTANTQPSFSDALRGPGGVGNLRGLRTEPSRPGPADDPLNQKFRQYFPDLALQPAQDLPIPRLSTPSRGTPRASMDSVRSQRSNSSGLGDVGVSLEGWVRKLATKNLKERNGNGKERMGDLIELETNSEVGDVIEEEDVLTPRAAGGQSSAMEEALLDERFPVRGRVRNAYGGAGGGDGKDKGD